jgi:hypothetical protein
VRARKNPSHPVGVPRIFAFDPRKNPSYPVGVPRIFAFDPQKKKIRRTRSACRAHFHV